MIIAALGTVHKSLKRNLEEMQSKVALGSSLRAWCCRKNIYCKVMA